MEWAFEVATNFVGRLVLYGGGSVALAYAAFTIFGRKMLDSHFSKRLESLKHNQNKEIESIRYRINTLFDRAQKLHQFEFNVLPSIWESANVAFASVKSYSSGIRFYSDISDIKDDNLVSMLEGLEFNKHQIEHIINSVDRQKSFIKMWETKNYTKTENKFREFTILYRSKRIFLQKNLQEHINELVTLLDDAILEAQLNNDYNFEKPTRLAKNKLFAEGEVLMNKIEEVIKSRIWDSTTSSVPH